MNYPAIIGGGKKSTYDNLGIPIGIALLSKVGNMEEVIQPPIQKETIENNMCPNNLYDELYEKFMKSDTNKKNKTRKMKVKGKKIKLEKNITSTYSKYLKQS